MNRCTHYITAEADSTRQAEHDRRVNRILNCRKMYPAAEVEANAHGVTMTCQMEVYRIWDERHSVAFYPIPLVVMRSIVGAKRLDKIELTAECDCFDVLLMFLEGKFLQC